MKGIENISRRILDEAKEKAEAIRKEAEEQAARTLAEAREKAEAEAGTLRKAGADRVADIADKARLSAAIEVRKQVSAQKQAMIQESFDKALEQLIALPVAEYTALLTKLALEACGDGLGGELVLNAADRDKCGQAVLDSVNSSLREGKLTLAADAAGIRGGLVIRRGKIEMNCALEVIVRMLQESISGEVAACLFGKGA